ncbi:non-ribosomal peptide synthetase [Sandaracinus amylolyticus]|uniref:Peptide synthetase n=1 Tax=Sandaracinus amylolyticus TaxID=927083 RepID=A0A0F6YLQ3_9BACT|nr:non-ribosomal peptide synthetase [Sandaracinus amylolyticus]AKF09447.1 Peptide synthetase [Sandaracinus amylolyticus]
MSAVTLAGDAAHALDVVLRAREHEAAGDVEFPLTPTQHAMLVHSLRASAAGVEIEQLVVQLPEAIDVARMRAAWTWGVDRFEALRTHFVWHDGEPRQRVVARATLPFEHTSTDDLVRFLAEDRARGVDLGHAPGARVTLLSRGPLDHTLVFTFHHALLDGRSFTRVLREVMQRYDEGETYDPPRPPSMRAHCEHLATRDLSADRAFWSEHLRGFGEPTPLPGSRATAELGARHVELEARLGASTTSRLVELGVQHGFTLANAVQAAWAIVLARHAREDDVCFGSTRAARHGTVPEALEAVGCLIHTTPLRVAVAPDRELLAVLRDLRAFGLAVRAHEHAPLTSIREWTGLPASTPLFESLVVFERYLVDRELRALGGAWSARRVSVHEQSEPPLVLAAYQDRDDLILKLEHDPARFDPDVIAYVLDHVVAILRGIAERPQARVGELVMIGEDEQRVLLALAGGDGARMPCDATTITAAIADVARRAPDALALTGVSFAQLDRDAGVLAARLAHEGVAPGDVVAVSVPRGRHLAIALLGVLRAGAVYLPIDREWPRERVAMVLEDAGAKRVIVDARTRDAFTAHPCLAIDEPTSLDPIAPIALDPDAPATLIYTSGSTGRPKGVLVPHRALLAHARAIVPAYTLDARDRCLQFTSPSFDVSLEEMLPTWLAGACVVPRSEHASSSIDAFLVELERHAVTVVNVPSAFFTEVALHLRDHDRTLPACVRLVIVGGERPSARAYATWRAQHPDVRFVNAYGPTEVTITSTLHDPGAATPSELPIGRPLGTCRAYVLDAGGQLAPRGAIGELALSGPQVALGYHARPELTAARFVPDPFAPGATMMRTGDLVRWSARGELEILGRADEQLKIRGFRIEPGEIESVLRADARVRDVVVGARPDASGALRLVAWVVLHDHELDPALLRATCEASLPGSMIPSAFVRIDALPITPSGKVDRRALPSPELGTAPRARRDDPPEGAFETWIAALFCELLGVPEVGANESFFELGGHSLLAVRLLSKLSARGPIELGTIFRAPTVRALARAIENGTSSTDATLVPLNARAREPLDPARAPFFLLCGVQLYAALGDAMSGDRAVFGGLLACEADVVGPPLDVQAMAPVYLARIRALQPHGPYLLGGVSFGGVVAYEVAQRLRALGERVELLVLLDTILPRGLHRAGVLGRARTHLERLRDPRAFLAHVHAAITQRLVRRTETPAAAIDPGALTTEAIDAIRDERFRAAAERHDPTMRPYEGPALVFTARHRRVFPGDRVDRDLGWTSLLRGRVAYHPVDGNHLTILREPGASEIARVLRERLQNI